MSLELEGDPHGLDEGVQVTVSRVVQEALTNTLKHAVDPAGAAVRLVCRSTGGILLEILDDGHILPSTAAEPDGAPGGRGLTGMRERATAYGGAVEAGPRLEGGWRVRLQLLDVDEARLS